MLTKLCLPILVLLAVIQTKVGAEIPRANGPFAAGKVTLVYNQFTGSLRIDTGQQSLTTLQIESAKSLFTGPKPVQLEDRFDIFRPDKLFWFEPSGFAGTVDFAAVLSLSLDGTMLSEDLTVIGSKSPRGSISAALFTSSDCNNDLAEDVFDVNCTPAAGVNGLLQSLGLHRGDVDGNRAVEFPDFLVLAANFGGNGRYTDGDFDKSGDVGFPDFLILSRNFGDSASVAAVPESCGFGSLLTAGMLLASILRARRIPGRGQANSLAVQKRWA